MAKYNPSDFFKMDDAFIDEYRDILPVLYLICIRLNENGLKGIFVHDDGYYKEWDIKHRIGFIQGSIVYAFRKIISGLRRKSISDKVFISDNFLMSPRYKDALSQLFETGSIIGNMSAADCNIFAMRETMKGDAFIKSRNAKKQIPLGTTIADKRLKDAVVALFNACQAIDTTADKGAKETVSDALLKELKAAFDKNVWRVARVFSSYRVSQFISVNEYNLRDIICISAAEKAGVTTKYYSHFCKYLFNDSKPKDDLIILAKKAYFWDDDELNYVTRNYAFNKYFGKPELLKAGSPEIMINKITKLHEDNPKQDVLFLFIPSSRVYLGVGAEPTEDNISYLIERKLHLFAQIKKCADSNGLKVLYRHNPNDNKVYNREDDRIFEEYGFISANGSADVMHEGLAKSKLVFSDPSSTLYLSQVYGCETYALRWKDMKSSFVLCEEAKGVKEINVDDIDGLKLNYTDKGIRTDCCFKADELLA